MSGKFQADTLIEREHLRNQTVEEVSLVLVFYFLLPLLEFECEPPLVLNTDQLPTTPLSSGSSKQKSGNSSCFIPSQPKK